MTILSLSTPATLFLSALAVFRLAYLITHESGPMFVFWWLRKEAKKKGGSIKEVSECAFCCGMWCSIAIVTYLLCPYRFIFFDGLILVLAVAGAAMLFHQVFVRLQGK